MPPKCGWLALTFVVLSVAPTDVTGNGCLLEDERNSVYVSVFEDAPVGSTLKALPIRGETYGPDADIQLRLLQGSQLVSLDPRSKALILEKALDRDNGLTRFEVVVECRSLLDDHLPQLNISTFVTVKDVNDNAPVFDKEQYSISIPEELPIGTLVALEFEATDADQEGPNSFIRYRIVGSNDDEDPEELEFNSVRAASKPPLESQYLRIPDPYKPQIVVGSRIDFEKIRRFEVEIEAEDGGTPSLKSRVKLTVVVEDTDDLNPVFQHENYYTNSIQDSVFEIFPDPIFAKDGDTLNELVFYELSGEFADFYSINSSGTVRLVKDTVISTTLFVHAKQVNRPERAATAILRVTNQSSIEFQHLLYSIQLTSNSPKGMEVAQVKAISSTPNTKLRYNILEDDSNIAYIEELTGRVFLNATPTKDKYSLRLLATDGKSRAWSRLELTVKKVNVYEPEFDQPEYLFEVRGDGLVGQVRAVDRDENDTITYRLLNLQSVFCVDADGMLSTIDATQLNSGTTYEVVIMAEDSQKHKSFVNVLLRTRGGISTFRHVLVMAVVVIVAALCVFIGMLCMRRVCSCYSLPMSARHDHAWHSKPYSDTGVVMTRSASTDMDIHSVQNRTQRYGAASPAEEKDRETVAISYANAAASFPPTVPQGVITSQSATSLGAIIQATASQHMRTSTVRSSPGRERPSLPHSNTPTIYF